MRGRGHRRRPGGGALRGRLAGFVRRDRSGAAALEFALALIVALPLLIGLIEAGRALHNRNALEFVADMAARSVLVQLRYQGLTLTEMEQTLLDGARDSWTGTAPERMAAQVQRDGDLLRIQLSYRMTMLIPFQPMGEITLRASRSVPAPAD